MNIGMHFFPTVVGTQDFREYDPDVQAHLWCRQWCSQWCRLCRLEVPGHWQHVMPRASFRKRPGCNKNNDGFHQWQIALRTWPTSRWRCFNFQVVSTCLNIKTSGPNIKDGHLKTSEASNLSSWRFGSSSCATPLWIYGGTHLLNGTFIWFCFGLETCSARIGSGPMQICTFKFFLMIL